MRSVSFVGMWRAAPYRRFHCVVNHTNKQTIHIKSAISAQIISIDSDSLEGVVGSTVVIACAGFRGSPRQYQTPGSISIRSTSDMEVFNDPRLSSRENATHRIYTLQGLRLSDAGLQLYCTVSEITSPVVTIQVQCKMNNS